LGGREWQRGQRAARDSSWIEIDIGYFFSFLPFEVGWFGLVDGFDRDVGEGNFRLGGWVVD